MIIRIKNMKAGALYYAVFIAFILSIMMGFFIYLVYLSNLTTENYIQHARVKQNAQSGITYALGCPAGLSYNAMSTIDLFEDGDNTVDLEKKRWGGYDILISRSRFKRYYDVKTALAGTCLQKGSQVALYLADNKQYLSIAGKTRLEGTCYLPKLGIRTVFIEGQSYQGTQPVYGETKDSDPELPALNEGTVNEAMRYLKLKNSDSDSILEIGKRIPYDTLRQSFLEKTMVLQSHEKLLINHNTILGNVRIASDKAIIVTRDNTLEDVILSAPLIYFQDSFRGSLQAFASDTLYAGKQCNFEFPSILAVINDNTNNTFMMVDKNSRISGTVLNCQADKAMDAPQMIIGSNVSIEGEVYCNGSIEIKGSVTGSVYCHSFVLHTPAAIYENHLLNTTIDFQSLSPYFAGSNFLNPELQEVTIKWLE